MIISELFESPQMCPECGGPSFSDLILAEEKDACYNKVRSRYKVWPSAYASGALVQCRKKGAANWGNKSEGVAETIATLDPDNPWGPEGNFAGDKRIEVGNVSMKPIAVGDTVKYFSEPAEIVELSRDRKIARIHFKRRAITQNVQTSDLTQLGQGVAEGRLKEFAPAGSGKRYAGRKKKADGTYKNVCVPVGEGLEKEWHNYQGLRDPKNEPGVNLFPGKDIVGQRVYHCTNRLKSIVKSGGLKPRSDTTGANEYGRLTTDERPFIPAIGIFFSVDKPEWPSGRYCLSWEIEPSDKVYVAYAKSKGQLNPDIMLNPVSMDRITVLDRNTGKTIQTENFTPINKGSTSKPYSAREIETGVGSHLTPPKLSQAKNEQGLTQQQWLNKAKKEFGSNIKNIKMARMVDGPVLVILTNGEKLMWRKTDDQLMNEGFLDWVKSKFKKNQPDFYMDVLDFHQWLQQQPESERDALIAKYYEKTPGDSEHDADNVRPQAKPEPGFPGAHGSAENELKMFLDGTKPAALVSDVSIPLWKNIINSGKYIVKKVRNYDGETSYIVGQQGENDRVEKLHTLYQTAQNAVARGDMSVYQNSNYHRWMGKLLGYSADKIEAFINNYFKDTQDMSKKPVYEEADRGANYHDSMARIKTLAGLNEFAPAGGGTPPKGPKVLGRDPWGGDDGGGDDPYGRPEPKHYSRSIDYFGRFEADHFDDEVFDNATGVFKGYWDDEDGRVQIGYFKFDDPEHTGSDDPGMGWYYEPQEMEEGIKGEIAGGAVGSLVGGAAGAPLGMLGNVVGSAIGGSAGAAIGSRWEDEKPLKEKQQLDEFAPLLLAGARLFMAVAPKIAQVVGRGAGAAGRGAAQATKSGAEIAAKNAGQIGMGIGAYEIGSSVADIAKDITAKVGTAVDQKTILELATVAFKYAIPAGIVLAILYGGKKAIDSLFSDSKPEQGVKEAKADPSGSWVVYDGDKVKRFKTREGANAYAQKNGGKVASSEYYADKIQKKPGVAEGALAEMDKSAPQPGRDGRISHKTYGSRGDEDPGPGPEKIVKIDKTADVKRFATKELEKAMDKAHKKGVAESTDNLNYIGNCTDDDVIEHIFGDATGFAQAVEEHGDEFTIDDLVVKYDPESDVHSFYYKKKGVTEEHEDKLIGGRYTPDEFDDMVGRVKKLSQKQEQERGPVDIKKLADRLRNIEKRQDSK